MAFTRKLPIFIPLMITVGFLFIIKYGVGNIATFVPGTKEQTMERADIFVPLGKKYKLKDNIIYHCLSMDTFKTADTRGRIREFTIEANKYKSEGAKSRAKAFQDVFEDQSWFFTKTPDLDKMSENYQASGIGSTLEAGQPPLALLNSLIERLKIYLQKPVITIIDIPCGDFHWIKHLVGSRSDVQYTGVDIVPSLIERHRKIYRSWKNAKFLNLDIVSSGLQQSYDIILSKDMLQHLTFADALKVLEHFSTSGSKLLVATQLNTPVNSELDTTLRYRPLNLMLNPFNLVPPICSMNNTLYDPLKEISVWKLPLQQRV